MIRKLKMAGVLMAVVAMFALTASSASALFTSTVTSTSGFATSTGDVFDLFGSTAACTNNQFNVGRYNATASPGNHEAASFPTETLTVVPTYNHCTVFGLPGTVNFTGCDYVLYTPKGGPLTVDLVCPAGVTGVDITAFSSFAHTTPLCHVVVHPFLGKGGITASNNGAHVDVKGTVEGITATQSRTNAVLCPPGTHTNLGKYTVQAAGITIKGVDGGISVS